MQLSRYTLVQPKRREWCDIFLEPSQPSQNISPFHSKMHKLRSKWTYIVYNADHFVPLGLFGHCSHQKTRPCIYEMRVTPQSHLTKEPQSLWRGFFHLPKVLVSICCQPFLVTCTLPWALLEAQYIIAHLHCLKRTICLTRYIYTVHSTPPTDYWGSRRYLWMKQQKYQHLQLPMNILITLYRLVPLLR